MHFPVINFLIHRLNLSLSGRLSRWRRNQDDQNVKSKVYESSFSRDHQHAANRGCRRDYS